MGGKPSAQYNMAHSAIVTVVVVCLAACRAAGQADVTWYVAPWGSSNITTCGRNETAPCSSLQTVLSQYPKDSTGCYQPPKNTAVLSTTVYFIGGFNVEPSALCLAGWTNLAIVGKDSAAINSTAYTQAGAAFLQFTACSNVTLYGLAFLRSFLGSATVAFTQSRDLAIGSCTFPVTVTASAGIQIKDSSGSIVIENVLLYSIEAAVNSVAALQVSQGDGADPFNLTINNCTFRDILSDGQVNNVNSYNSVRDAVVALRMQFQSNTAGNVVTVQNSLFTRLRSTASNVVGVDFDTSSSGNLVQFIGCEFRDNTARYGGGVSTYFWINSSNNTLLVQGCNFTNNTATLEGGGVLGVFISEQVDNRLEIQSSTFIGNTAAYGAGVFILNNPAWYDYTGATYNITPALVSVNISNCTFINNVAPICEGIVSVLRVLLYINGRRYVSCRVSSVT